MRAVEIAGDRSLRVVEAPAPAAGPDEAVVDVAYCGICGTDLQLRRTAAPPGAVLGHEIAGTVREAGGGGWRRGDRVCVFPFLPCGECPGCRAGEEQICAEAAATAIGMGTRPGGYAEAVVAPTAMLRRLPADLALERAALAEPLAVGLHAVANAGTAPKERAVVLGAGPIGAMTALALRARGFEDVTVVEPNRRRRRILEGLGFACAAAAREPAASRPGAPAAVFDCAGSGTSLQQAIRLVAPGGSVVLVGAAQSPLRLAPATLLVKEAQIRPSFAYRPREFDEAIAMLAAGAVAAEKTITSVVPLAEAATAFERLESPETEDLKILLRP